MFTLPKLAVLALDGNLFNGSLPATLPSASGLTLMEVSLNRLTGEPDSTLLRSQPHRASHRPHLIAGTAMLVLVQACCPCSRAT